MRTLDVNERITKRVLLYRHMNPTTTDTSVSTPLVKLARAALNDAPFVAMRRSGWSSSDGVRLTPPLLLLPPCTLELLALRVNRLTALFNGFGNVLAERLPSLFRKSPALAKWLRPIGW